MTAKKRNRITRFPIRSTVKITKRQADLEKKWVDMTGKGKSELHRRLLNKYGWQETLLACHGEGIAE